MCEDFSVMECEKCGRKSIKYRCIGCKSPICNVCSVSCSAETPGYCEDTYRVGKCEECQGSDRKRKISNSLTGSKAVSKVKPRQSSLSSFLKVKSITPCMPVETPENTEKSQHHDDSRQSASSIEKLPATSGTTTPLSAKPKSRNLSVAAANRWVTTNLAAHLASEWLVINADKAGHVVSLNCSVCKIHADKLRGMKNFSNAWAFSGSTNLRLSNAEDHARGEPHKRALDLHLKGEKGQSAMERAESMRASNQVGQQLITSGIANMQASDLAKTKIKFDVAYFIAKEELPLSKFPELLKLEEKHGVDVGTAYRNDMSCNIFIKHIGEEIERNLKELSNAHFFSVLTDGSEDASISEMEAVFVQHLEKNPPGRDTIQVATSFVR